MCADLLFFTMPHFRLEALRDLLLIYQQFGAGTATTTNAENPILDF